MAIYVHRNGQQLGPFEEKVVISSLRAGQFSGSDLGIRQGESDWRRLGEMFPEAHAERPARLVETPKATAATTATVTTAAAGFRKTTLQKIFFALAFLGSLAAMIGAAAYWKMGLGPSGNLETDLGHAAIRDLMLYLAASLFVLTVLAFFAFLLTFKRKIIASNGLRIAMRLFFILLVFVGIIDLGYSGFSYFTHRQEPTTTTSNNSAGNELLKALEKGDAIAGPLMAPAMFGPVGAGLILLGLSGALMTRKTANA